MRLLLAHGQTVVLAGLRAALGAEPTLRVIGEEWNGEGALAAIRVHQPDVALLDAGLPGISGIELARRLFSDANRSTALVVISAAWQVSELASAFEAGVSGCVAMRDEVSELIEAMLVAGRGETYLSSWLRAFVEAANLPLQLTARFGRADGSRPNPSSVRRRS